LNLINDAVVPRANTPQLVGADEFEQDRRSRREFAADRGEAVWPIA
jgi:hypothetical protein